MISFTISVGKGSAAVRFMQIWQKNFTGKMERGEEGGFLPN
jgi:hypothetical protein